MTPAGWRADTLELMRFKNLGGFVTLIFSLAACGSDGGMSPTANETRVSRQSVDARQGAAAASFLMGGGGTIEVSADWTIAGNNVDVYLTSGECRDVPSVLTALSCDVKARAEGETARPERLTFPGAAGTSYQVFVLNRGGKRDTVTVTLTVR